MAPLNPFPARPAVRPSNPAQQDRGQQTGWPGQSEADHAHPAWPQPQAHQSYPNPAFPQDYAAHAQHAQQQPGPQLGDPFAPQFEPYVPPQRMPPQAEYGSAPAGGYQGAPAYSQPQAQPPQHGGAPQQYGFGGQPQWPDPHGFDGRPFGAPAYGNEAAPHSFDPQGQPDWDLRGGAAGYSHDDGYQQPGAGSELGFAHPADGDPDHRYGEDEEMEYEEPEQPPRRAPRYLMMVAALGGAIVVGGGMAYGYRAMFGGGAEGEPPVVKSASAPSKTKPADAGGMQFDHADRKIMSRLGEGSAASGSGAPAEAATDDTGSRKVSTLVVGRDGTIQAPPTSPAPSAGVPGTAVVVPGMTVVDGFGAAGRKPAAAPPPAASEPAPAPPAAPPPAPAAAPPDKPITVTRVNGASPAPDASASMSDAGPAAEAPKPTKKVKVAAANPDDAFSPAAAAAKPAASSSGITGYVAVLASIPRSDSSRMDALKRFADLQQKYGSILAGKTPDVADASLGTKGSYHRLVVGPPGSREKANTLCAQLKAEGFGECWVTAY